MLENGERKEVFTWQIVKSSCASIIRKTSVFLIHTGKYNHCKIVWELGYFPEGKKHAHFNHTFQTKNRNYVGNIRMGIAYNQFFLSEHLLWGLTHWIWNKKWEKLIVPSVWWREWIEWNEKFIIRIMCENLKRKVFDVHLLKHIRLVYYAKNPFGSNLTLFRRGEGLQFGFVFILWLSISFLFPEVFRVFTTQRKKKCKGKSMTFAIWGWHPFNMLRIYHM